MTERNEIVKLAVDTYGGTLHDKYSKDEALDTLREAFIDLNGGSTKLNYKRLRDNPTMFSILEEILDVLLVEGIQEDNFFQSFVDYRNIKLGDDINFYVDDPSLLVVNEIASGTQNIRRQRLNAGQSYTVPTSRKAIKIYEELELLLAGRIDFNKMIDRVGQSFRVQIGLDIYQAMYDAFNSLPSAFTKNGAYDEEQLVDLVDRVEAVTGRKAIIAGTRAALRKVTQAVVSESAKEVYNELGYYGVFNGTPMIQITQAIAPGSIASGTYTFALSNNDLFVIASDVKPIKFVTEGESLIVTNNGGGTVNQDLSVEYMFTNKWGVGVVLSTMFGIYRMA